jgi:hypothetical protein
VDEFEFMARCAGIMGVSCEGKLDGASESNGERGIYRAARGEDRGAIGAATPVYEEKVFFILSLFSG